MIALTHHLLQRSAARTPDKIALVCQGKRVSYGELQSWSDRLARFLIERGFARGDRLLVFADNSVETVVAFWAASKAGGIASIVHAQTKADKLRYILQDSGARAMVVGTALGAVAREATLAGATLTTTVVGPDAPRATVDALLGGVTWEDAMAVDRAPSPPRIVDLDVACLIYTSGTTGEPKGVMLTHRNLLTATTSISTYLENREDDVLLCMLPLAFGYGLTQLLTAASVGGRVILERSFAYPAQVLNLFGQEKVTGFAAIPTALGVIGELKSLEAFDMSSLRYVTNAAAALPPKHVRMLRDRLPHVRIVSMYGQTECLRGTWLPHDEIDRRPSSMGIPIPNTEAWIADDNGARVPPGTVGELVIRGSHVMKGYWNRPAETQKKLRPGPHPGELVLHTGDLCSQDDEGFFHFVSRMDDIIKCRGEKVSPKEVENAILDLDGVRECAVVGVPDDLLGEAVKAFCVLEQGATVTERQIIQFAAQRLEGYMVPKVVEIVAELPRTMSGKITKVPLRNR
ncbi:MAG: AMP-binding protein [Polyangiaceae bacterium]|nr:AMP-binding protein [Polyangiaceae bacterium]